MYQLPIADVSQSYQSYDFERSAPWFHSTTQAFHTLQHCHAARGSKASTVPTANTTTHSAQHATIKLFRIAVTAQDLEHIACERSSPALKSSCSNAVSLMAGRPTCHPKRVRCATDPCQRVVVSTSKWFKRVFCLFEACERPLARYLRTFHTAVRNPSRQVVFARLSCDQAHLESWGRLVAPVNPRCRIPDLDFFLFEHRVREVAKPPF